MVSHTRALSCWLLVSMLTACAQLPSLDSRSVSTVMTDTADTRLGQAIRPKAHAHPGKSGVFTLRDGRDAFAARMLLAEAADRTLDVQYYIWHGDMSGILLFEALHRAADRGVRVRLLLDDNNTKGLDTVLAALDSHPNIEVRLFNPFMQRRWRALGYLTDFSRLNRRMHNKSFTADNQATVIGGRNVGDEYFGAGEGMLFIDLDVLAIGPVVGRVSKDFDRYWASRSAYPVGLILPPADASAITELAQRASAIERNPAALEYIRSVKQSPFLRDLLAGRLPFEWTGIQMVSDDPAKGLGRAGEQTFLTRRFQDLFGEPENELLLVSPYFVPGDAGEDYFTDLARKGRRVSVLTNSLEATDVAAVHAGYARRRTALLDAGVELFELKRASAPPTPGNRGFTGSSGSSLHSKVFAVDRARVFIGSFNFDPRSTRLNTEMGFIIDSPAMAQTLADVFADRLPDLAYEVRRDGEGGLCWIERRGDHEVIHKKEPGSGFGKRLLVRVLSWMPIEWLL